MNCCVSGVIVRLFHFLQIPESKEGRDWFYYVDRTVTMEMLEQLTNEYLVIYDNSPSRLKKQLNNCKGLGLTSKSVRIYNNISRELLSLIFCHSD